MTATSKVILITGATSGIGRGAAIALAKRGHQVIASGRRDALLAELAQRTANIRALRLDVTDETSVRRAKAAVLDLTGGRGLDVLINNAGCGVAGPLETVSAEDLRAQFDTNVFGLMAVSRAFIPHMRQRRSGRVINVGSVAGRLTLPGFGAYHATKYALEALSDALRLELHPFGVAVSLIEPGFTKTEFVRHAFLPVSKYLPPGSPYVALASRGERLVDLLERHSAEPGCVVRAMIHAVEARRPRIRYVVPFHARAMVWVRALVPTRVADWILRAGAGLSPAKLGLDDTDRGIQCTQYW